MINRNEFGHATTTNEVLDGIDLTGKLALVTGGTSGLGKETARALAAKGARVVFTARNLAKGEEVAQVIRTSTGNDAVEVMDLELASFASIRAFADAFLAKYDTLDMQINNAGVMVCPFTKTEDGFELQFGTNHLGHFLLTNLIARALINADAARVISVSSVAHKISPVLFDDINFEQRDYDKWIAYGQSKTANVLFAVGLDSRLVGKGVRAYALHPGVIMTPLLRHMPQEELDAMFASMQSITGAVKTVAQGAATQVYAATAPELDGLGGLYLSDCQLGKIDDEGRSMQAVRSWALDPALADHLWSVSEEMVGQQFVY